MNDNFKDIYTFIKEQKNFIKEQEETDRIKEYTASLFDQAKPNLDEFSGGISITYDPIDFNMKSNKFNWSGTLGNKIKWLYSYGEGNTGFFITADMLQIDSDLLEAIKKMNAYFNYKFADLLKDYL